MAHSAGLKRSRRSSDLSPSGLDVTRLSVSDEMLELGEDLLDRVEIGAVGRQKDEVGAFGSNDGAGGFAFVVYAFEYACARNDVDHRLTKPKHPWTNGQVERMNRTIKDATVKRSFYATHDQLRAHLRDFVDAYNFARRLKTSEASPHTSSSAKPGLHSQKISNSARSSKPRD